MARSTIQEKFAGASSLNLPQALSIVEAIAEHARENNISLPARETSQETWRERIVIAAATSKAKSQPTQPSAAHEKSEVLYDIGPLRQAEMHDLVELISQNRGNPPATWLPSVIRGMLDAEMTITDFLKKAAEESPPAVVQVLRALEDEFPYHAASDIPWEQDRRNHENTVTVGQLVRLVAPKHGASASPAIIVGLRRQKLGHHVDDFLTRAATWYLAPNLEKIINHLRAAALKSDSLRLLRAIGSNRRADRVAEVLEHFSKAGKQDDVDQILVGIGSSDKYRLRTVAQELEKSGISNEARHKIAKAIEYDKHEEYAQLLDESGLADWAKVVREHSDDLPF